MLATDTSLDALDEQVSTLSPAGQAELARRILARLEIEPQEDEILRRLHEIREGTAESVAAEDVLQELRDRFG